MSGEPSQVEIGAANMLSSLLEPQQSSELISEESLEKAWASLAQDWQSIVKGEVMLLSQVRYFTRLTPLFL